VSTVNYARRFPRFWLIYFVLSLALLLGNAVFEIANGTGPRGASGLLGLAFGVVGTIPLYGFVRQRRNNPKWLWVVLLVAFTFWLVVMVGMLVVTGLFIGTFTDLLIACAAISFGGPYTFALYQYIFRSPGLWQ
jgi:hypothetical protein